MRTSFKFALAIISCTFFFTSSFSQVTMRDTTWTWKHFGFNLRPDNTIASTTNTIVNRVFNGKVIENEYIKILLLPEYGGRILSYIYKPTGHEQIYQNPVGTPFGIDKNNFYYDWLMVYGGIFPTFPESEHGKGWFLPWDFEVITNTSNQITVRMSFTDTIDINVSNDLNFNNGLTGITCHYDVTVYDGRSNIQCDVKLVNDENESNYEYWTCCTFTPGSVIGDPKSPGNSEIVSKVTEARYKDEWWSWMKYVDPVINSQEHLYKWDKLKTFNKWNGEGIAYAKPNVSGNYFGVINHVNEEGILRIADNENYTKGLKMWTWGFNASYTANPNNSGSVPRPYIELWAGLTEEFFWDATLAPNQEVAFQENYMPTVGLSKITEVNEHAAVYLEYDNLQNKFVAKIFSTYPDDSINIELNVLGATNYSLFKEDIISNANSANVISLARSDYNIVMGDYDYEIIVSNNKGTQLLTASIPYTDNFALSANNDFSSNYDFQVFPNPSTGSFNCVITSNDNLEIDYVLIDAVGNILKTGEFVSDKTEQINIENQASGVYFLKMTVDGNPRTIKLIKY